MHVCVRVPEHRLLLDADAPQSLARAERIRAAGGTAEGINAMCLKVCLVCFAMVCC